MEQASAARIGAVQRITSRTLLQCLPRTNAGRAGPRAAPHGNDGCSRRALQGGPSQRLTALRTRRHPLWVRTIALTLPALVACTQPAASGGPKPEKEDATVADSTARTPPVALPSPGDMYLRQTPAQYAVERGDFGLGPNHGDNLVP